jgi:hypothetical protein
MPCIYIYIYLFIYLLIPILVIVVLEHCFIKSNNISDTV